VLSGGVERVISRRNGRFAAPTDHGVRFYGADSELAAAVAEYLAEGLRSGDGVLVVATEAHRRSFAENLAGNDIDVRAHSDAGRLLMADAAEQLDRFLAVDRLDHELFESVAADLIQRVAGTGRRVRIYAEMVALLWDAGQVTLAIELEELWNELGAGVPFSLLCGYPARLLADAGQAGTVRQIFGRHSSVTVAGSVAHDARGGHAPEGQAAAGARSFPCERDSIRAARHFVTGTLTPAASDALADDAAIIATELAANAVLHAKSAFTVTVSASASAVRIAVRDGGLLTTASGAEPFQLRHDHGLGVVSRIARRWAVERLPDGKVVWAELGAGGLGT
jgi:anti-sigma regulatory factor (Ser/Thr protein kinase)